MKTKLVLLLVTLLLHASWLRAQGTAFTYQGRLTDNGSPANGAYDLQFSLRDAAAAGNAVGATNTIALVSVSNGLFNVTLDFGAGVFTGGDRWLEIGVKSNGVAGAHTLLTPLQPLTPSPYAIFAGGAQTANTVSTGGVSAASLAVGAVDSGTIADGSIQSADLSAPLLNGTFWRLNGNTGTTPGVNFIGTADNQPLELNVNGTRALRIEPNTNGAPNLIGGAPINVVDAGIIGATIGGGGAANYFGTSFTNRIAADFGVIAGGILNTIEIGAGQSTIGGGFGNIIQTSSSGATIAGGQGNFIEEGSARSVIGGGFNNHVETDSRHSTIGGGIANHIQRFAEFSTISGGMVNTIHVVSSGSTIGGGDGNTIQTNASRSVIGGGGGNVIQTDASSSTISGGSGNAIQRAARQTTISGGGNNNVFSNATSSAIGGGFFNQILVGADYATIPGGTSNSVAGDFGFAAGQRAKANHTGAFVWADSQNADFASTGTNQFLIRASGGVGIGTNNPAGAMLNVNGIVRAAGFNGPMAATNLTGAIAPANIAAGTITSTMLAAGSVTSVQLAAGSVNTTNLADGAVTAAKVFSVTQTVSVVAFPSPNSSGLDNFGVSVSAVGTTRLVIGADRDNNDETDAGAAYLYSTDGTELIMFTKPIPVAGDLFGHSVAGVGTDRVLIGAYLDDTGTNDTGAAYLFNINGGLLNTFTNPTPAPGDNFGYVVAAVGTDRVLIGAYGDNTGANNAGAAYLFNVNGALLNTFTNPTPFADDDFGFSVAAVGTDLILIGAQGDNTNGDSSGAAYLFSTNGTLLTTFINPTPSAGDHFGNAVAAVGTEKVLIGAVSHDIGPMIGGTPAVGAAYLFSTNGTLLITFNNPAPFIGDSFGYSVAAMGTDQVLIGENASFGGAAARLYRTNGSLVTTFTNPASGNDDSFGSSVAAVGNRVLVGTPGTTAAYLFTRGGVAPGLFADGVRAGAITAVNLAAGAVGSDQIADGAVGSAQILDGSITAVNLSSSIGVWTASGTNVYRSQGKVGIGTSTIPLRLTVAGSGSFNSGGAAAILLNNTTVNGRDWEWHALDDGRMHLVDFTAGLTRLLIDTNGNVGLGEASPGARLDVRTALNPVAQFNRTGDDGVIVQFQRDNSNVGSVTVAAGLVSYNAFTGSHYAWTKETIERGMLVSMTGDNRRSGDSGTAEIIYGVDLVRKANDPRCLGAYLGLEEPKRPASDKNPHQIMSVGNGEMWVTERGGDLEPGDYLISSAVPGCAMKDDPARFPVGHIIARAAECVNWSTVTPGRQGLKRTKISVLFTNFERHTGSPSLAAMYALNQKLEDLSGELERRDTENADLKLRLEKLEQQMNPKNGDVK